MALSDYMNQAVIEDTNTAANLGGAVATFTGVHYAKQSLEISKKLLHMFQETHEKEDARAKNLDELFTEILSELKKLNSNIEKLGGIK